jgi:hypothetical protein
MTSSRHPAPEIMKTGAEPQTIRSFDDLLPIVRARIAALDLSYEVIDAIAGLSDGYTAKLMGPSRTKKFGRTSAPAMLGALGLQLAVIDDPAAFDRLQSRLVQRRRGRARNDDCRHTADTTTPTMRQCSYHKAF